ncbi:hypothetical protein ABT050_01200 [Streptomyces mirabilis]
MIIPPLVGVAEILAPMAATGLVAPMIGAAIAHGRRNEIIAINVVLLAAAATVAWGRFGPHAF